MTPEEKEILQRLSAKAQRYQSNQVSGNGVVKNPQQQALEKSADPADTEEDVLHTDVYAANLTLLRNPQ
jgi:hypothetical protein